MCLTFYLKPFECTSETFYFLFLKKGLQKSFLAIGTLQYFFSPAGGAMRIGDK